MKRSFQLIAFISIVLITTLAFSEIKLPSSTIIFSKPVSAATSQENIWFMSNSTDWKPRLLISGRQILEGKLSPDGKNLLCFDSNRIYTFEYSFEKKKAANLFKGFNARYSPSGKLVAFISQKELSTGGVGRIVEVYDRQSKQTKIIAEGKPFPSQYHSVSWVSDNEIAFVSESPNKATSVLIYNLQGQQKRQISFPTSLSNISGLVLAPDGLTWLFQATNRADSDVSRIYSMKVDGNDVKKSYEDGSKLYHYAPSWAPDSKHIAFSSSYEGTKELIILDIRSGETIKTTGFILDWGGEIIQGK